MTGDILSADKQKLLTYDGDASAGVGEPFPGDRQTHSQRPQRQLILYAISALPISKHVGNLCGAAALPMPE
jgi:hypothetical protein